MKNDTSDWLDSLPYPWEKIRIKYLANKDCDSFIDGDWIESPYITDSGIRYLTTGNIGDGIFKRQGNGYISEETFDKLKCKYVYPGDLIISRLNSPYGRSCILPNDEPKYIVAVDNVILRTDFNKKYICYVTQCDGYHQIVEEKTRGTAMQRISRSSLGNIKIPLPPFSKQSRIASFLDDRCAKIDASIQKCKDINDKLDEYRKAVITKAVTKGVRGEREMKYSGIIWIDEIPKGWSHKPLKAIFNFGKGLSITKANLVDAGSPVISYGQIHAKYNTGVTVCNDLLRFVKYEDTSDSSKVSKNDMIFADTSEDLEGCGNCVYVDTDYPVYGGYHTIILTSKNIVSNKYLAYLVKTDAWRFQIRRLLTEVKLYSVSQKVLKDTTVILPSEEEQIEIVAFLDKRCAEIDSAKAKNEAIIKKLEEYKKSLIYNAVTGKIEC